MPRTTRRKLAKNIYADNHGFAVVVTYKGRRLEKRVKRGASRKALTDERSKLIQKLKLQVPAVGTFKSDALDYLQSLPDGPFKENRDRECRVWFPAIGSLSRTEITAHLITAHLHTLTLSASSKRKALTALKAVWRFHDGPDATTPTDHITPPKESHDIRGIPQGVVTAILRKLPKSKTRARLKVLARTGLPHKQIAALEPHHLDLDKREITVSPRRKGKGSPPRTIPITFKAVRAFKEFQRVNAWGPFSRHSMWRMFQQAVKDAQATWKGRWPARDTLRPYDLRHAFLTEAYRQSRDLRATAELGLHKTLAMAARYAAAAVSDTAQAARDAMDGATRSAKKTIQRPTDASSQSTKAAQKNVALSRRKTSQNRKTQSGARGRS